MDKAYIHLCGNGNAVLLNGPSSAGKSSVAGALQKKLAAVGVDAVILSVDDYMQVPSDEEIWEDDVFEIMPGMCRDVTQALQEKKTVIVDHVITSARIYEALTEAAAGFCMKKVRVSCSVEILRRREAERGDRYAGSAETSLRYLYPKEGYDLYIDSGKEDPDSIAGKIMEILRDQRSV